MYTHTRYKDLIINMQAFNRLINGDQVVRKQFIRSCIFFSFLDCNKKPGQINTLVRVAINV